MRQATIIMIFVNCAVAHRQDLRGARLQHQGKPKNMKNDDSTLVKQVAAPFRNAVDYAGARIKKAGMPGWSVDCPVNPGGTCYASRCSEKLGNTTCFLGGCKCAEGFCADHVLHEKKVLFGTAKKQVLTCIPKENYCHRFVGSCQLFGCRQWHGEGTECIDGECKCAQGFCGNEEGYCLPNHPRESEIAKDADASDKPEDEDETEDDAVSRESDTTDGARTRASQLSLGARSGVSVY